MRFRLTYVWYGKKNSVVACYVSPCDYLRIIIKFCLGNYL